MKSLFVILGLVVLTGCSQPEPGTRSPKAPPPLNVQVAPVRADEVAHSQAISGIVRPVDRAAIAANIMGKIKVAQLAVGQSVNAGDILVEIEAAELEARLSQARAALGQAERDLARDRELVSKGAAARESVLASEDRHRIALAAWQEAQAMQAYQKIAAPFDGVITSDLVNPGDLATPGQTLFELEGIDHLRAEVLVPESLSAPQLGSAITVVLDDAPVNGRLVELSPSADPSSRTRLAKIELPSESGARSGQYVRAHWPAGSYATLTVPSRALSHFGQMERVYVVEDGQARLRIIKTGATHDDRAEVLSGLEAGETVIIAPPSTLRDGQAVEILK